MEKVCRFHIKNRYFCEKSKFLYFCKYSSKFRTDDEFDNFENHLI